jgi:hypothetical protein
MSHKKMPHLGGNFFFIFTPLALADITLVRRKNNNIKTPRSMKRFIRPQSRRSLELSKQQTADCSADFVFTDRRHTMGFAH